MMTLRKKIFIIAGIVIGILLAIILLIAFLINRKNNGGGETLGGNTQQPAQQTAQTTNPDTQSVTNAVIEGLPKVEQQPDEIYVKQLAGIFVERFYSFSNQNDNSHVEDALLMSTEKMATWIKTQTVKQEFDYTGQTTRIVSSKIEKIFPDKAQVSIGVRQGVQSKGSSEEAVIYRDGLVDLVKVNGEWKVDRVTWEQT